MDTSDIATALAASIERVVEQHCEAIRAEAEKVIAAFRQQAARLAGTSAPVRPAPPVLPAPPTATVLDEEDYPPRLSARVREL